MTLTADDLGTAYYALEWVIRIGALGVVPMRRPPSATAGWLLLIFFLPVPGLILFLAIGSPHFPGWRKERFRRLRPFFDEIAKTLGGSEPDEIAALARTLGYFPTCDGNTIELIDGYDALIDRLVADIDAAHAHVRLLVYIFASDAAGQKVAAALGRAIKRGVAAQVMFDPVGSHKWRRATLRLMREAGVEVRESLPLHFPLRWTRRDMRNHRKLFVIDGRIGYAGSQNIVGKAFRPGVVNHELVARITGPVVAELAAIVRGDWFLETEQMPDDAITVSHPTGEARLQLLPSGADYPLEGFETLLVWQLHRATKRVVIATPYFIPDEDVLGALRTAAARGVEVELVMSAVVDQRLVNLAQCSYYDDLLTAGIRINLYRDKLLHAKNSSFDGGFAVVGSSNVDLRSFQLNEEASLLLYDAASVAKVEAIQRGYLENSDRLDLARWRKRSRLRRLAENIARLVSPLL